jgi:very-short-patch-repair endonuclease
MNKAQHTRVSQSECCIAAQLRKKEVPFQQQVAIANYCVDFLVPPNIVLEPEGIVHSHRILRDAKRTEELERMGFRVFRIPNCEIFRDPAGIAEMVKIQWIASFSGARTPKSYEHDSPGHGGHSRSESRRSGN